jgi:hypothetical protein
MLRLCEENTAEDRTSLLRWANKTPIRIAKELTRLGHLVLDGIFAAI